MRDKKNEMLTKTKLELSPEVWAREVEGFSELLNKRASKPALLRWVKQSQIREELFGLTVLGIIRWPKELGRPGTKTLAEGFVGKHWWWFEEWHVGLGGEVIENEGWAKGNAPSLWDAPDEPGHYRVYYTFPERPNPNIVEFEFSGTRWVDTGPARLPWQWSLNPRGFLFTGNGGLTILPTISVERRPILKG